MNPLILIAIVALWYVNKNKAGNESNNTASNAAQMRDEILSWLSEEAAAEDRHIYMQMTASEIEMIYKFKKFERAGDFDSVDKMWPIVEQIAKKYKIAI